MASPAIRELLTHFGSGWSHGWIPLRAGMSSGGIRLGEFMNCINIPIVNNLRKSPENAAIQGILEQSGA
jgi:hypothetical protein